MPIYYHQKEFAGFIPTLLKCLKGKACFNFTKDEQLDLKELETLLKEGARAWKKLGYLE